MFLFYNAPIDWRATKQRTVTTSTAEAELLSLSEASWEMMWWTRLFEAISLSTEEAIYICCDNAQTAGLMNKETPELVTRLRHVDIHQMWLRQQVQGGIITAKLVPTSQMVADGFTKLFGPQGQANIVDQLNMVNVEAQITKVTATPKTE